MSKYDTIPRESLIGFLEKGYAKDGVERFMRELDVYMGYEAPTDEEILKYYGWERECSSPHEIRHFEGSFASGQAANVMMQVLREEYKEEQLRG